MPCLETFGGIKKCWSAAPWDGAPHLCHAKAGDDAKRLTLYSPALWPKIIWPQVPIVPKSEDCCPASSPSPVKEEGCEQLP